MDHRFHHHDEFGEEYIPSRELEPFRMDGAVDHAKSNARTGPLKTTGTTADAIVKTCLERLQGRGDDEDWRVQVAGIIDARRLCLHHQDVAWPSLRYIVHGIMPKVDSLRSALAKHALMGMYDVIHCFGMRTPFLESIIPKIVKKACDTNAFIKSEAERVLGAITALGTNKVITNALCEMCEHPTGAVRATALQSLEKCVSSSPHSLTDVQRNFIQHFAETLSHDANPKARQRANQLQKALLLENRSSSSPNKSKSTPSLELPALQQHSSQPIPNSYYSKHGRHNPKVHTRSTAQETALIMAQQQAYHEPNHFPRDAGLWNRDLDLEEEQILRDLHEIDKRLERCKSTNRNRIGMQLGQVSHLASSSSPNSLGLSPLGSQLYASAIGGYSSSDMGGGFGYCKTNY